MHGWRHYRLRARMVGRAEIFLGAAAVARRISTSNAEDEAQSMTVVISALRRISYYPCQ